MLARSHRSREPIRERESRSQVYLEKLQYAPGCAASSGSPRGLSRSSVGSPGALGSSAIRQPEARDGTIVDGTSHDLDLGARGRARRGTSANDGAGATSRPRRALPRAAARTRAHARRASRLQSGRQSRSERAARSSGPRASARADRAPITDGARELARSGPASSGRVTQRHALVLRDQAERKRNEETQLGVNDVPARRPASVGRHHRSR